MIHNTALEAIADRIRQAHADATPLAIRGGGSKDFYGDTSAPPVGEPLLTLPLSGIVSYEPSELVVTARAGTPLAELEALLAEQGQCLPFEPPHFGTDGKRATVGGMVAAGFSGPARASVGAVRDHVLGARLLNGRGQLLTFGGQVMKNVAGYDVSRVLVGSLGVLGVLVEVSLKVLPTAKAEATLRFELSEGEALSKLNQWGGQPLPLNASCWLEDGGTGVLSLRLRGAQAAVKAACQRLGGERIDNAKAQSDWADCREQRMPWFTGRAPDQALWRLSLPQTARVRDLPESPLIEWHGAQRWVRAQFGEKSASRLRAAAAAAGGHATPFIAQNDQWTSGKGRFEAQKSPLDRIQRELKREFDPAGIFNRGRLSPDF